jgi:hypothetical protein
MQIDQMGEAVPEHVDQADCRTKVEMDNLWECLAAAPVCFPGQIAYGPVKYCAHKEPARFGVAAKRRVDGAY